MGLIGSFFTPNSTHFFKGSKSKVKQNSATLRDNSFKPFSPVTKCAFTLAEVLITLGIIGVVAALTLPNLVDNYYKSVAEARLKKFYSVYNQAILLAEAKYGPKESWYQQPRGVEFDDEGNAIAETNEIDKWFSKYLEDFMTIKKKSLNNGSIIYYLNDGSIFRLNSGLYPGENFVTSRDIGFYPFGNFEQCYSRPHSQKVGICEFWFIFYPMENTSSWKHHFQKGMEPYKFGWDGEYNSLFTNSSSGCSNGAIGHFCTAIIQLNGWRVPKNYPRKIHP